jgi:hypothetical protein
MKKLKDYGHGSRNTPACRQAGTRYFLIKKEGIDHGKTDPMGNISHDGQGEVKEGEETDLAGFLQ